MARQFRNGSARRIANRLVGAAVRVGLGPRGTYLMTVAGRTSGVPRTTPVILVRHDGSSWLVAPYGEVAWVRNVRSAGSVTVRRGRRVDAFTAEEVGVDSAAPVLRAYLREVPFVRPFVEARPDDDLEVYKAIAPRHPVFRLS